MKLTFITDILKSIVAGCRLHVSRIPHPSSLILLLSFLPILIFAQDQKPPAPKILPFQQDAPAQQTDEQLALQLYQSQEYEKAGEIYQRIYDEKPSQYIYQYLIYCLVETKEYGKAEKLIKKAQKSEPNSLRFMVDQGYIGYRSGNEDKAKKIYEDALKKLTPSQQQISDLANAFTIRGENEYAIRTYRQGKELMNNSYPFGFELASVYERMGDFNNAMNEYLNLLEVNPSYLQTVQDRIQANLAYDINNEKNESFRKALLGRVQREPEKSYYSELLWWYSIQQKDFELAMLQAKAIDRRMKENGDRLMQLASLAISNEQYDVAIECYRYLVAKGAAYPNYLKARRELASTRYQKIIAEPSPDRKQLADLEKEIADELAASPDDPDNINLMRNLAHIRAFYLDKQEEAVQLLNKVIDLPGVVPTDRAKCKIELADILLFTDDVWEATLLYQQAYQDFKFDALGQEAKFKNAKLSFYIGEFRWAQAQADVLKAATSKFIANDAIALSLLISENYDPDSNMVALGMYARAELLDYRNKEELALATLDSIPRMFGRHPILQYVLYKKADIMKKEGKYIEADSIYKQIGSQFAEEILADESLMQRALLNENQLGRKDVAMELYQNMLDKYPGSIFVPDARKKYRLLRGDK